MRIVFTHDKPLFAPQIAYVQDVLFSTIGMSGSVGDPDDGVDDSTLAISYGRGGTASSRQAGMRIHIFDGGLFSPDYMSPASLPTRPVKWSTVGGEQLPLIYVAEADLPGQPLLQAGDGSVVASRTEEEGRSVIWSTFDLLASAFFMLSRYEEALIPERDQFDRFPFSRSLACHEGFVDIPVVNLYAALLREWIRQIVGDAPNFGQTNYLGEHRFAVCLTHDVDHARKFTLRGMTRTMARAILRPRERHGVAQIAQYLLSGHDPYWCFDRIRRAEGDYGYESSFFLATGRHHNLDPPYASDERQVVALLHAIQSEGGEVGLHGSFLSHTDSRLLAKEAAILARHTAVWGGRQHYLRLDIQKTFDTQQQAGLRYDCTLGHAETPGFRAGFALPFRPYDFERNRPFDLVEIPLAVMDTTLHESDYLHLEAEAAQDRAIAILTEVKKYNGCVAILWHNGYFDGVARPGYGDVYRALLAWIHENGGVGMSGRQVHEWFAEGAVG